MHPLYTRIDHAATCDGMPCMPLRQRWDLHDRMNWPSQGRWASKLRNEHPGRVHARQSIHPRRATTDVLDPPTLQPEPNHPAAQKPHSVPVGNLGLASWTLMAANVPQCLCRQTTGLAQVGCTVGKNSPTWKEGMSRVNMILRLTPLQSFNINSTTLYLHF